MPPRQLHHKTQELLARLKAKKELADILDEARQNYVEPHENCIACGNTGRNSHGGLCDPCVNSGRIKCVRS